MWFLLLTLLEADVYTAHSVYATQQECVDSSRTQQDVCVAVSLNIIRLPADSPITVTELPELETTN